ncbi:MAG: porin family protein [Verrucomicrobiota bacterium]|nr:porin family protein [Verrucomicrobiota bacterium]
MKQMKWLVAALVFVMLIPAAMGAALITRGSSELAVDGNLDFASSAGTDFVIGGRYAYFFWDRLSLGTKVAFSDNDEITTFGIGLVGEYNFTMSPEYRPLIGTDFVPFIGMAVDYRYVDVPEKDENAFVGGLEAGCKFFLTDSAAVALSLLGEVASEKIYPDDHKLKRADLMIRLGMRFYF